MDNSSSRQAKSHRKSHGISDADVDWRVVLIFRVVQLMVGGDDPGNVIALTKAVEETRCGYGKIGSIPYLDDHVDQQLDRRMGREQNIRLCSIV